MLPLAYELETLHSAIARSAKQRGYLTYLKFETGLRAFRAQRPESFLYLIKLFAASFSYPAGNFGGIQLLDSSISLSPLYPGLWIDLHVRTHSSLHQSFL